MEIKQSVEQNFVYNLVKTLSRNNSPKIQKHPFRQFI